MNSINLKMLSMSAMLIFSVLGANAQMKYESREDVPEKYKWDLTDIYSNWDEWQKDFDAIDLAGKELAKYEGKLGASIENFSQYTLMQEDMYKKLYKVYSYAMLNSSLNGQDMTSLTHFMEVRALWSKIGEATSWAGPETLAIPEETMKLWVEEDNLIKQYKHGLLDSYRMKMHTLTAENEAIIASFSQALSASQNTYSSLATADIEFPEVELSDGSKLNASPVATSKVLSSYPNQMDRYNVSKASSDYFYAHKNTFASLYVGTLQSRWSSAKVRNYNSCLEAALKNKNIPLSVYTELIKIAKDNAGLMERYNNLRKQTLGLENYYISDTRYPISDFHKSYTFDQAIETIEKALQPLGKEYAQKYAMAVAGGWIDVYETPNKDAGAYNMGVSGVHPYVLMNWAGERDDVFTLAHELGHCMHSIFSEENQPFATSDYESFCAEVASIFNEHLLLDYLIENAETKEEKISLLVQAIDNIQGTFYRQAMYADFELQNYTSIENGEALNADILAQRWSDINKAYYGNSVSPIENKEYGWPRIMHFYDLYYYVYQYATSFTASMAIHEEVVNGSKKEKAESLDLYLNFLKSGGSDYPVTLLQNAGVDLTSAEPYNAVVNRMEYLVNQLEEELK